MESFSNHRTNPAHSIGKEGFNKDSIAGHRFTDFARAKAVNIKSNLNDIKNSNLKNNKDGRNSNLKNDKINYETEKFKRLDLLLPSRSQQEKSVKARLIPK